MIQNARRRNSNLPDWFREFEDLTDSFFSSRSLYQKTVYSDIEEQEKETPQDESEA